MYHKIGVTQTGIGGVTQTGTLGVTHTVFEAVEERPKRGTMRVALSGTYREFYLVRALHLRLTRIGLTNSGQSLFFPHFFTIFLVCMYIIV